MTTAADFVHASETHQWPPDPNLEQIRSNPVTLVIKLMVVLATAVFGFLPLPAHQKWIRIQPLKEEQGLFFCVHVCEICPLEASWVSADSSPDIS